MKSVKKEMEVYIVEGKEFIDKIEAMNYEKLIKTELGYTFYIITHNPDLTEGRGYYKRTVIAVPNNGAEEATALQYCFKTFGNPLEFVQGCAPIANWILNKGERFMNLKDLESFKQKKICDGIGDYQKMVDKKIIYLNEKGQPK